MGPGSHEKAAGQPIDVLRQAQHERPDLFNVLSVRPEALEG